MAGKKKDNCGMRGSAEPTPSVPGEPGLRDLVDAAGVEVIAVDARGRVTVWNRGIETRTCPKEDAIGRPLAEIAGRIWASQAGTDLVRTLVSKVLGAGESLRLQRFELRESGGRPVFYDIWADPIGRRGIGVVGAVLIAADVTERYESSDRSLRSAKSASLANMGAAIAHEIRNPLNSISVHIQLLKEEIESRGDRFGGEAIESIGLISEEIRRLNRIVGNVLKFSRMPDPDRRIGDLNAVVLMAVKLLAAEAAEAGVSVEVKAGEIPKVEFDGDLMRQAVYNIVLNAIQACPGGRIAVSTRLDRHSVAIEISDTGPGIPPAEREKIFDLFYSKREGGTGLGLPIANRIVEEHGGRIAIGRSQTGGASFDIHLPLSGGRKK